MTPLFAIGMPQYPFLSHTLGASHSLLSCQVTIAFDRVRLSGFKSGGGVGKMGTWHSRRVPIRSSISQRSYTWSFLLGYNDGGEIEPHPNLSCFRALRPRLVLLSMACPSYLPTIIPLTGKKSHPPKLNPIRCQYVYKHRPPALVLDF